MITDDEFPDSSELPEGFWQPIYFRANFDTPERLVAGILAWVDGEWSLQKANALERLRCLHGSEANVAIQAVESGLRSLEISLDRNIDPTSYDLKISGLELGEKQASQSTTAKSLAQRWLRLVSSLHDPKREFVIEGLYAEAERVENAVSRDIARDRLSV